MTKLGLKRIASPKTWNIKKKEFKFSLKPFPGSFSYDLGLPLGILLRDYVGCANNMREAKYIVNHHDILINKKKKTDIHHIAGLMDVVEIPSLNQFFRILINKKGKLYLVKLSKEDAEQTLTKIKNIQLLKKGKIQLNLDGGKNLLIQKEKFKPGDSLMLDLSKNKIKEHFKFEKGSFILLIGGKHVGDTGNITEIDHKKIIFKTEEGKILETLKKYAYVLGNQKSTIKLE